MNKYAIVLALTFCMLFIAKPSRSDVPTGAPLTASPPPAPEPITAAAVTPAPGSETQPRDPFAPYDIGPAAAAWKYGDLTTDQKAVADHDREAAGWEGVHAAYNTAVMEQAQRAAANAAQSQIGIDTNLAGTGVVP